MNHIVYTYGTQAGKNNMKVLNINNNLTCENKTPTEDIFIKNVIKYLNNDFNNYTLVPLRHGCYIQKYGEKSGEYLYQTKLDDITKKHNMNYVFVTLSINKHIDKIKTYDNIFFSVHASKRNNHVPIPHVPIHYGKRLMYNDKNELFSFQGAATHNVRKQLNKLYPKKCLITPHFFYTKNVNIYKDKLSKSIFSLCPRGSGVNTIRLWESMKTGTIPVIISNDYKFPLDDKLNWFDFSVQIDEKDINNIKLILNNISIKKRKDMIENVKYVYDNYFDIKLIHNIVKYYINNKK